MAADDKRIERIEDKVDALHDKIGETNSILAANTASLKEHMRRTAILEKEIKPLKDSVISINAVLKALVIFSTALTVVIAIKEILKW